MSYDNSKYEKMGVDGNIYTSTIKNYPNFNAEADCNTLRKAMKGIGTDEEAIINCLGARSWKQRLEIKQLYKTMFGKDLVDELKSELSGDFCRAVVRSIYDRDYYDAYSLHKAMAGAGTTESVLTEILISRTNSQIKRIKEVYQKYFNEDLEKRVTSETSGFYKRILVSCLQANKNELSKADIEKLYESGPASIVSENLAAQEAAELFDAGEAKLGTDEAAFIKVFALRNPYQLQATFHEYQKISGKSIIDSIESETSGDLRSALKAIANLACNRPLYFASRIYKATKGAGTDDNDLIRLIITRSEIDMGDIKDAFEKEYEDTLVNYVTGDTSGDYRKYLLKFIEGN